MSLVAASTALNISITLLIIVLVVVSLFMILVVMMQRPKQEGLGAAFGGGMTDQLLGAGTTSFLQKATVILGVLFFALSLILGILVGRSNKEDGIAGEKVVATETVAGRPVAGGVDVPSDEEDELLENVEALLNTSETSEIPAATLEEVVEEAAGAGE